MDKIERASKGGRARAAKMTPEQRSEGARKAVRARWAGVRGGAIFAVAASSDLSSTRTVYRLTKKGWRKIHAVTENSAEFDFTSSR